MYRKLVLATLAITFALPLFATAASCPNLTRNLSFGSRGSDVVQLQQFLISQNLLATDSATGYFGRLTQAAVQKLQCKNISICSGSPSTNGWGNVGPRTRTVITNSCNLKPAVVPTNPTCPLIGYGIECLPGTHKVRQYDASGCETVPRCVADQTPPVSVNSPPPPQSCNSFAPQAQTLACPSGQTGSITETRTSSCATGATSPTWGVWETTSNTCHIPAPPVLNANLNDFWNGTAYFELIRKQVFPIDDVLGSTSGVGANTQQQIIVRDNIWYRFSREYDTSVDGLKIVIHASQDKGATWYGRTALVAPSSGTPWAFMAADGNAFYDETTNTWHYLFQCIGSDKAIWNVCYASRAATDPLGPWQVQATPAIRAGDLFKKMGRPELHDEGTPQIVEKSGDTFLVTFHGYDGVRGVRAYARTKDFSQWTVDPTSIIFTSSDCAPWAVVWNGGCIGGGSASTLYQNGFYYTIIEAADGNLACQQNQNWVMGLVRFSVFGSSLQRLSGNPIIFNTKQKYPNGQGVECGVQYAGLFNDSTDTYLSVWRTGVGNGSQDTDPVSGWYLYRLRKGAPLALYTFTFGSNLHRYAQSDVVSRGNFEAEVNNVQWLSPGLSMNGTNSVITLPDNPALKRNAPWTLELTLNVTASPSSKSALIAGDKNAAWLELYADNSLCAWTWTTDGPKNACVPLILNVSHAVAFIATPNSITLSVDGARTTTVVSSIPQLQIISIGALAPNSDGFYGSWQGTLTKVSFYDYAR